MIPKTQNHQRLAQNDDSTRKRIEGVQRQLGAQAGELKQVQVRWQGRGRIPPPLESIIYKSSVARMFPSFFYLYIETGALSP